MYCKFIIISLLLLAPVLSAHSQQNTFDQDMTLTIRIFDANGRPFVNPNADAAGYPFFIEGWKYGTVTLTNNALYSKRLLRLDLENQEIHYLSEKNIEMTLAAGFVKQVNLIDSAKSPVMGYSFKSGFPATSNMDEKYLYLVLCDGKIKLLESVRKKLIIEKNDLTGEIRKEYRTYEDYYLLSKGEMKRLKKDKDALLAEFTDKKTEINQYMQSNKINYKNTDDIIRLINFYNSL